MKHPVCTYLHETVWGGGDHQSSMFFVFLLPQIAPNKNKAVLFSLKQNLGMKGLKN